MLMIYISTSSRRVSEVRQRGWDSNITIVAYLLCFHNFHSFFEKRNKISYFEDWLLFHNRSSRVMSVRLINVYTFRKYLNVWSSQAPILITCSRMHDRHKWLARCISSHEYAGTHGNTINLLAIYWRAIRKSSRQTNTYY